MSSSLLFGSRILLRTLVLALIPATTLLAVARAASDIIVVEVDISALTTDCATAGAIGTVAATVRNVGDAATGVGFDVLFFEDANANGTYENGTDLLLGEGSVPGSLDPGDDAVATAPVNATLKFVKSLVYALGDSQSEIAEANETNNIEDSGASCAFEPPPGGFNPVIEWAWTGSQIEPDALNVMMTPAVIDLNEDGIPDIVFGSTASTGGGYVEIGFLRALSGDTGAELFTVTDPAYRINTAASIAVGDIDLDDGGLPEILAADATGSHLLAFENDGTFKWSSAGTEPIYWGAPSIADLDQDGTPEIIVGRVVLNNDGTLRWTGTGGRGLVVPDSPISVVSDVDHDGAPNIVGGNTVYDAGGAILSINPNLPDGLNAVANFDDDPEAEIVLVSGGQVWLLEHDCSVKWGPVPIPGGGGGPPTVADYDGDGEPEIGVAGTANYVVYETDGTQKWAAVTQDASSSVTGSSVFDFEGDGSAEVVYRDELYLRVYRGTDGTVLYQIPMSSCTWHEYVLVADVDADGNAEMVAVANNNCGLGQQRGVYVLGDANDTWVSTRRIWNEHAYHITNVNDDGTIPQFEQTNWLYPPSGPYNNFRQNTLPGREPLAAPNLTASLVHVDAAPCPDGIGLVARIGNAGSNVAAAPVSVAFYDGDPGGGGILLGTVSTANNLAPGGYEDVALVVAPSIAGPHTICAAADDAGGGVGALNECDETDNLCCVDLDIPPCEPTPVLVQNASISQRGSLVELAWSVGGDVSVLEFRVHRSLQGSREEDAAVTISAGGTKRYLYRDDTVRPGGTYVYRIEALDGSGSLRELGEWAITVTAPSAASIVEASPNPARTGITIVFETPVRQDALVAILDGGGRVVRSYRIADATPGRHSVAWDLRDGDGRRVQAGVYAYRVSAGRSTLAGKIVVLQ